MVSLVLNDPHILTEALLGVQLWWAGQSAHTVMCCTMCTTLPSAMRSVAVQLLQQLMKQPVSRASVVPQ